VDGGTEKRTSLDIHGGGSQLTFPLLQYKRPVQSGLRLRARGPRSVWGRYAADLLPPAAERFIDLNQALILVISRLRQREFG
jgi:hypothetical protein